MNEIYINGTQILLHEIKNFEKTKVHELKYRKKLGPRFHFKRSRTFEIEVQVIESHL